MRAITIPTDFERYPEFVRLVRLLSEGDLKWPDGHGSGSGMPQLFAQGLFIRLWTELAYASASCEPGCLPKDDIRHVIQDLCVPQEESLAALLESKMLAERGAHYFCRTFLMHNEANLLAGAAAALGLSPRGLAEYRRSAEEIEKRAAAEAKRLADEFFAEVDGAAVASVEMNRALALVRILDGIQQRPERALADFGVGLVHEAVRVVRRFDHKRTDLILRRLLSMRRNPDLPRTSERILSEWDSVLAILEPESGWRTWESTRGGQ